MNISSLFCGFSFYVYNCTTAGIWLKARTGEGIKIDYNLKTFTTFPDSYLMS